jgi:hypothetical protein
MEATQPNLETLSEAYQSGEPEDFQLVLGGPFFQLLRKAHLEGDALELLHRRVIASVVLTWFPLLVLSILSGVVGGVGRVSFFHDIEVHARFLVALPILIAAELLVNSRIRPAVRRFIEWRIVLPEQRPVFRKAIDSALKIRNSVLVELALIAVVYTVGLLVWNSRTELGLVTWYALPGSRWNPNRRKQKHDRRDAALVFAVAG